MSYKIYLNRQKTSVLNFINEWFKFVFSSKYLLIILLESLEMLTDAYHCEMRSNRMLEKNLSSYQNVRISNFQIYFNTLLAILQMSDNCGLKRQTKYLIKKNLDGYILHFPYSTPQQLQFAAINIFRLSIKYNEDPSVYDQITIQLCMGQISSQHTRQDFINFQLQFYQGENFGMDFTTPYDYLGTYAKVFPISQSQIKKIYFVLDFTFTIPELMFNSAEEIFFGAMLKVFSACDSQKIWILSQTFFQQESKNVFNIITQYYQNQVQAASNAQFQ